jgi:hypothetical protein
MNELFKQILIILLGMTLFAIAVLSLFMLNPFGILIGVFGLHWLWNNMDKLV